ncbi:GIY-YIG nuclease family protein [Crocosphaera sp.]|uniref:GIY-YIG nuclease family protein n=1 Tax=Crocosphaera sp. TaxID=2729996 RepID=UPI00261A1A2F|nr:GIY-YIG nuclease family protein [Crocosphaera sp.]MDJ0579065.1 GIY-YIG nuclease family protein [Crocosphaera sp.]
MINPKELDLSKLPWLPLDAKSAFPRQPAIYFAIDSNDVIQYIGRSINPKQRWSGHHKYDELQEIGKIKVSYLFVEDSKLLPDVEKALIKWFCPPLNIALVPGKTTEVESATSKQRVSTYITIELKEKAEAKAKEQDRSLSNYIERLIKADVEKQ